MYANKAYRHIRLRIWRNRNFCFLGELSGLLGIQVPNQAIAPHFPSQQDCSIAFANNPDNPRSKHFSVPSQNQYFQCRICNSKNVLQDLVKSLRIPYAALISYPRNIHTKSKPRKTSHSN